MTRHPTHRRTGDAPNPPTPRPARARLALLAGATLVVAAAVATPTLADTLDAPSGGDTAGAETTPAPTDATEEPTDPDVPEGAADPGAGEDTAGTETAPAPTEATEEPADGGIDVDGIVRPIMFPVDGHASFWNDWHQPRDGGARLHLGTDIAAPKLTPVLSAVDGVVARIGPDAAGRAGNHVVITDAEGWEYAYLHLNNDTPGTDDNANPTAIALGPGIEPGAHVAAGQVIGFVGDSGNAETTLAHVHFEIRAPGRIHINPFHSLDQAWQHDPDRRCQTEPVDLETPRPRPTPRPHLVVASNGSVIALDGAAHHGDLGGAPLDAPIVAAASTPGGGGYWLLGADGGVFTFGDAEFLGSLRSHLEQFGGPGDLDAFVIEREALLHDGELRAVDIESTPDGRGYWVLTASGETVEFGTAVPLERPPVMLEAPAVDLVVVRGGAWIVAADGGVFTAGSAPYHGSLPERRAEAVEAGGSGVPDDEPAAVVALITHDPAGGYTLVDGDGAAHDFGTRLTEASHATEPLCEHGEVRAAVAIDATTHRVLLSNGSVRTYGRGADPLDDRRVHDAVAILAGPPVIGGLA